jgi:organic hydroperoxide reductase OsmC/OhrA
LHDENGVRLTVPEEWTPEHLLLAALGRCSLASLRYHAERANLSATIVSGSTRALITRRETDGRYAVIEATVEITVDVEPQPGAAELEELLGKAERDCFVGASLTVKPSYRWTVNGRTIDA